MWQLCVSVCSGGQRGAKALGFDGGSLGGTGRNTAHTTLCKIGGWGNTVYVCLRAFPCLCVHIYTELDKIKPRLSPSHGPRLGFRVKV